MIPRTGAMRMAVGVWAVSLFGWSPVRRSRRQRGATSHPRSWPPLRLLLRPTFRRILARQSRTTTWRRLKAIGRRSNDCSRMTTHCSTAPGVTEQGTTNLGLYGAGLQARALRRTGADRKSVGERRCHGRYRDTSWEQWRQALRGDPAFLRCLGQTPSPPGAS
jgi:hypothetical protein